MLQKMFMHLCRFTMPSALTVPMAILDTALPGTPVSILHDDGKIIAHGILSQAPETSLNQPHKDLGSDYRQ